MSSQSILRLLKLRTPLATNSLLSNSNKNLNLATLYKQQQQQQITSLLSSSLFHSSSNVKATIDEDTSIIVIKKPKTPTVKLVKSSIGSGKGGKIEKEALIKLKLLATKEKLKLKELKEKEKLLQAKLKLKVGKEVKNKIKEKEKLNKLKLKTKNLLLKEKLKLKKSKAKKVKVESPLKKKRTPTSNLRPPKAAPNSWGVFLADFVAERKASTPTGEKMLSAVKLAQEAAILYRDLAPSDRQELERRSQEAKAAYPSIYAAWKATLTPSMIKEENSIRKVRKANGLSHKKPLRLEGEPKRPSMPFLLFCTDIRNNRSDEILKGETSVLEQSKLMAAAWREASDEEKKVFNDQYAKAKAQYAEEKAAFDAKHSTGATTTTEE